MKAYPVTFVSGVRRGLSILPHIIFKNTLLSAYYQVFTEEEIETQLSSYSQAPQSTVCLRGEPRLSDSNSVLVLL